MKLLKKLIVFIIIGLSSQLTVASGQRSTVLNNDAIEGYTTLILKEVKLAGKRLNYIGTVNSKFHILMITKTSSSKNSSGHIGMPWSRVFTYKINTKEISIVNGWDITNNLKHGGFKVRPSNCPRITLSPKQNKYIISNKEKIELNCLPSKSVY